MAQNKILTEEEIVELRKPIDEYVGKIQTEIDELRADGAKKVQDLENHIMLLSSFRRMMWTWKTTSSF